MSQSKPISRDDAAARFAEQFRAPIHQPFLMEGTNGKAALFVHGFPGTPAEMRPMADAFHQQGWTVSGILLPGFGAEIETLARRTHQEWAAAVSHGLAELRARFQRVVLIGFSLGGALSVQAAASGGADALIAISPFVRIKHVLWQALPVLKVIIPNFKPFSLIKPNFSDPDTRQSMRGFLGDVDFDDPTVQQGIRDFAIPTHMLDQIRAAGERAYRAAPRIEIPTLVIQGLADELVPPESTRALTARIPGAVYQEIPGDHIITRLSAVHQLALEFSSR